MNTLHGFIALVALIGVVCRLARMHRASFGFITWNVWAGSHAVLGAGLFGVILAAGYRCPLNDQTVFALLLGVTGLVLTHWRRRREDR